MTLFIKVYELIELFVIIVFFTMQLSTYFYHLLNLKVNYFKITNTYFVISKYLVFHDLSFTYIDYQNFIKYQFFSRE